jgi:hypothetical protein
MPRPTWSLRELLPAIALTAGPVLVWMTAALLLS